MQGHAAPYEQIGRFLVDAPVGQGGMGVVYRASDPVLNRPVAIKLLAPHLGADATAKARFQREASLIASLKHTNIASIYEFGDHDGQPYIAMEWIEGRTLKQLLADDGALGVDRSLRLFKQLASALDYAHDNGVVHRDLKPSNIIVNSLDQVTIVDFGLAWIADAPSITLSGSVVGTPRYMAPEQIQGGTIDGRTDQYALGLVLYEMLVGTSPFNTESNTALYQQQMYAPPPAITERDPSIPLAVEAALNVALEKSAESRHPTVGDFYDAIKQPAIVHNPQQANPIVRPLLGFFLGLAIALGIWGGRGVLFPASEPTPAAATLVDNSAEVEPDALTNPEPTAPVETPADSPQAEADVAAMAEAEAEAEVVEAETPVAESLSESEASEEPDTAEETDEAEPPPVPEPSWNYLWGSPNGNGNQTRFVDLDLGDERLIGYWSVAFNAAETTSPILSSGRVMIAENSELFGLNWTDGQREWEAPLGDAPDITPVIFPDWEYDTLIVATADGGLTALTVGERLLLWQVSSAEFNGNIRQMMIDDSNQFTLITDENFLYGLNPYNGEVDYELSVDIEEPFIFPPTTNNLGVFVADGAGGVAAIDTASGDIDWYSETDGVPVTPPIVIGNDATRGLAVATSEGILQAFSVLNGAEMWRVDLGAAATGLASDWWRVFVSLENGMLTAIDATADGEISWSISLDATPIGPPAVSNNQVVVAVDAPDLRFYNTDGGEEVLAKRMNFNSPLVDGPMLVGDWVIVRGEETIFGFGPPQE